MSRRRNPHDRSCLYVTTTPAAPPPGRRLPIDEPAALTIIAR
jgi:hypothetical protein